jgi:hypothetical protein
MYWKWRDESLDDSRYKEKRDNIRRATLRQTTTCYPESRGVVFFSPGANIAIPIMRPAPPAIKMAVNRRTAVPRTNDRA